MERSWGRCSRYTATGWRFSASVRRGDVIGFIGNIASVFNGHFAIAKVNQIVTVLLSGLNIIEKILFLGLGIKALNQGTIVIPFIDKKVSKYID